jgi:hypothetical protein
VRVRLTRKLARRLDGIDLTSYEVGDIIDLPVGDARTLVAEGWATSHVDSHHGSGHGFERLRELREQMERRSTEQHERRRAEDRIREELRDERAVVVGAGGELARQT